ncbi:MAG: TCR/Tet family MFS transporter [Myxococcota bacterium]
MPSPTDPRPPAGRAALSFVLVTVVLDVLSLGIIVPVFPHLVAELVQSGDPGAVGDTAHATRVFGWFGTAWAVAQFVCSPILGALSDRFGRRPVLLASMIGLGLDYVLMALAPTLVWLFVGRVLSGMTAASFSTANAYISDVTPPERRGAAFGAVGAAFGVGFVLGPAVGGLLGGYDPRLPFWVAAGFSLVNAAYGLFVLPESLPPERRSPLSWRRANPIGSLVWLASNPGLGGLAAAHLLAAVGQNVYPAVLVLYAGYRYGWDERAMGLTLAAVGVSSIVVQGGVVRPALAWLGERRALLVGLGCASLGYLAYGLAPTGLAMLCAIPIAALGGLYTPASQGLMTRRVDAARQGSLQGALAGLVGIGSLVSPLLYTRTFARAIDGSLGFTAPGAPFFVAAGLLALAVGIGWRATRPGGEARSTGG